MLPGEQGASQLRLAIQKEGRLTDDTLALLRSIGLEFESFRRKLFSNCRNFPLALLHTRDDDIPEYVSAGTVDLGIVGRNLLHEEGVIVEELLPLGFGYCSLVVAVPKESAITSVEQLAGAKIATSYPRSAQRFFDEQRIPVEIITISGSVEVAPLLGLSSAIVDLTATGSSLVLNDLRPICTILESEAVLAAHPAVLADAARKAQVDRLMLRIRGVLAARRYRYVMMNAPRAALDQIYHIVPGLKMPTVVPLADPEWVAVHTAVREEVFWEVIEALREAGASEILVSPIEKLVL
ncbi:MAG TPA: ATP phosphoribosyltransferase [Ktedonobacterales bacterium]|nr:ATP phosphoribosyltransferase [Ktedonobacterales bacterium]